MEYLLTTEEMRFADRQTIDSGAPSETLMERAGLALADACQRIAPTGRVLLLCGGGNNGGDGFVCARVLKERQREVDLVCYAENRSADCAKMEKKWLATGEKAHIVIPKKEYALVVDCLYGTGFHGKLAGKDEEAVLAVNALQKEGTKVLACDIPSGVNGNSGFAEGLAVQADDTLCIGEIKRGVLFGDGIDLSGRIERVDIGITLPNTDYPEVIDFEYAKAILPKRKRNSHKGTFGRAGVVGGSTEYTGAPFLSANACLHTGAGYTTLFLPEDLLSYYILKAPEILLKSVCEGGKYGLNEKKMRSILSLDSVAYGMGMGVSKDVFEGAKWLVENYEGKLILDADGLNSIAAYGGDLTAFFAKKTCEVLLTPHVKEFSRLSGLSVEEIVKNPVDSAKDCAKKWGVSVLLKNAVSVITDGARVLVNRAGTSGQAKGGTGDVLAGVILSLSAQGLPVFESGALSAYLVGRGAEMASREVGDYALTASRLIEFTDRALLRIAEDAHDDCR